MFLEEGKCCWCRDYRLVRNCRLVCDCRLVRDCCLVRDCRLVRIHGLVCICDVYLRLWGSGLVLALNREDS